MVKRPRGYLSKASRKLKRERRITVSDHVREFSLGQKVSVDPQPYYKSALPHMRYRGRVGVVIEKRGSCYVVRVKDGGKYKDLICHPVHLRGI